MLRLIFVLGFAILITTNLGAQTVAEELVEVAGERDCIQAKVQQSTSQQRVLVNNICSSPLSVVWCEKLDKANAEKEGSACNPKSRFYSKQESIKAYDSFTIDRTSETSKIFIAACSGDGVQMIIGGTPAVGCVPASGVKKECHSDPASCSIHSVSETTTIKCPSGSEVNLSLSTYVSLVETIYVAETASVGKVVLSTQMPNGGAYKGVLELVKQSCNDEKVEGPEVDQFMTKTLDVALKEAKPVCIDSASSPMSRGMCNMLGNAAYRGRVLKASGLGLLPAATGGSGCNELVSYRDYELISDVDRAFADYTRTKSLLDMYKEIEDEVSSRSSWAQISQKIDLYIRSADVLATFVGGLVPNAAIAGEVGSKFGDAIQKISTGIDVYDAAWKQDVMAAAKLGSAMIASKAGIYGYILHQKVTALDATMKLVKAAENDDEWTELNSRLKRQLRDINASIQALHAEYSRANEDIRVINETKNAIDRKCGKKTSQYEGQSMDETISLRDWPISSATLSAKERM